MMDSIGVLGAGHMGLAVIKGLINSGSCAASHILVAEHDAARRRVVEGLGCEVTSDATALRAKDVIVLCVRPQEFPEAAKAIATQHPLLAVSVMAGLDSETIASACGVATRVVRAMPNAAAEIGRGMTGLAAGVGATDSDVAIARPMFECLGTVVEVNEKDLWAVTAVSGSGLAWFYLLASAIAEEGESLGLSPDEVSSLVRGTIDGAAAMMQVDHRTPSALLEAVTTPGGTTEAGLAAMREAGLVEAARKGVRAAHERGVTLSGR